MSVDFEYPQTLSLVRHLWLSCLVNAIDHDRAAAMLQDRGLQLHIRVIGRQRYRFTNELRKSLEPPFADGEEGALDQIALVGQGIGLRRPRLFSGATDEQVLIECLTVDLALLQSYDKAISQTDSKPIVDLLCSQRKIIANSIEGTRYLERLSRWG